MKIGDKNFTEAVIRISQYQSQSTVAFNVPVKDNYDHVYPILLLEACPGLVAALHDAGYFVGICAKGAYVDKF